MSEAGKAPPSQPKTPDPNASRANNKRPFSASTPSPTPKSKASSPGSPSKSNSSQEPPTKKHAGVQEAVIADPPKSTTAVMFPNRRVVSIEDHHWLPTTRDEMKAIWGDKSPYRMIETICQKAGTPKPHTQWIESKKPTNKDPQLRNYEIEFCRPDTPSSNIVLRILVSERSLHITSIYLLALADLLYLTFPAHKYYTLSTLLREAELILALPDEQVTTILESIRTLADHLEDSVEQYIEYRESLFTGIANLLSLPDPYPRSSNPITGKIDSQTSEPAGPVESSQPSPSSSQSSSKKRYSTNSQGSASEITSDAAGANSPSTTRTSANKVESTSSGNSSQSNDASSKAAGKSGLSTPNKDANKGSSQMDVDVASTGASPSAARSQGSNPPAAATSPKDSEIAKEAPMEEIRKSFPAWTSLLDPVEKHVPKDPDMQRYFNYEWDDILPCEVRLWTEWRAKWTDKAVKTEDVEDRAIELVTRLFEDGSFINNEKQTIWWSEELYVLWVLYKGTVSSTLQNYLYEGQQTCGMDVIRLRLLYSCNKNVLPKFLHMLLQSIASFPSARQAARDLLDEKFLSHLTTVAEWAATTVDKFDALEILMYLCRLVDFALFVLPAASLPSYKTYRLVSACKVLNSKLNGEKVPWLKAAITRLSARAATPSAPNT